MYFELKDFMEYFSSPRTQVSYFFMTHTFEQFFYKVMKNISGATACITIPPLPVVPPSVNLTRLTGLKKLESESDEEGISYKVRNLHS